MTQHELKRTITVVEVPECAYEFDVNNLCNFLGYSDKETGSLDGIVDLPQGNWSILSTDKGMTEDLAKMIVRENIMGLYENYIHESIFFSFKSTLDSFKSFMQANGYTKTDKQYLILVKD